MRLYIPNFRILHSVLAQMVYSLDHIQTDLSDEASGCQHKVHNNQQSETERDVLRTVFDHLGRKFCVYIMLGNGFCT
jgi:hypothetical protein